MKRFHTHTFGDHRTAQLPICAGRRSASASVGAQVADPPSENQLVALDNTSPNTGERLPGQRTSECLENARSRQEIDHDQQRPNGALT